MATSRARGARGDRHMFLSADDNAMMKNILATHSPDGTSIDVIPLLQIIEDIMHRARPDTSHHGPQAETDAIVDSVLYNNVNEMLEVMALTINKVSCEISCKCIGGGDAHATTTGIFNMLSNYGWDAKAVITLAAFAVNYGEFWLVAQLYTANPLAKSLAHLKQLPSVLEHGESLKPRFSVVTSLIKAMLDVTHSIIKFKELPEQYISPDTPELVTATTHIPTAVYWIIRGIVSCASILINLIGMGHEHVTTTSETWELSSLAHKISNIHDHLKHHLDLCNHHINEKKHVEAYLTLLRIMDTPHLDNMKPLKHLIYYQLPLYESSTKNQVADGKYICLYGGEDIDWIRNFTTTAQTVARRAGIQLEMLYVGKSNPREKVRKNNDIIRAENLSYVLDLTLIWFFWVRLESMLHSKLQHGKSFDEDLILREINVMLTYDGNNQGWAVICRGSDDWMRRVNGETVLTSLTKYDEWMDDARDKGFLIALNGHLEANRPPHHCNRLILPGTTGSVPDRVVCAECGRSMESFFLYQCCTPYVATILKNRIFYGL